MPPLRPLIGTKVPLVIDVAGQRHVLGTAEVTDVDQGPDGLVIESTLDEISLRYIGHTGGPQGPPVAWGYAPLRVSRRLREDPGRPADQG